jgi:hypothetical protein
MQPAFKFQLEIETSECLVWHYEKQGFPLHIDPSNSCAWGTNT